MDIYFTEKDFSYKDEIKHKIEPIATEIVDFFELKNFGTKVIVRFWIL